MQFKLLPVENATMLCYYMADGETWFCNSDAHGGYGVRLFAPEVNHKKSVV